MQRLGLSLELKSLDDHRRIGFDLDHLGEGKHSHLPHT